MKKPNPEYIERIKEMTNTCPYFILLSMHLRDIGLGSSLLELDISRKHLQPFGVIHGGVFASIIDATAFWAVFFAIQDQNAGLTSVDLKLNYLAPIETGRIIAEGRQIKVGKAIAYAEARVSDEAGKLLAHGTSTLMILPGKGFVTDPPLPPKFIEGPGPESR
ncbi:MAG: PaaI family thioesterase [Desulfobacterales bacterium]|nr:PaaI family thioesterase [Desulfobacterales bacterium]